jgi:chromosome segregation ATPase
MSLVNAALSTGLLLLALGMLCSRLRWRQLRRQHRAWQANLQSALNILQRLQKHRGLGGQTNPEASQQRQQIAQQLDALWRDCPQNDNGLAELDGDWRRLRQQPSNFSGHCQLIEQLLNGIEQLELRLLRGQPGLQGLSQACREIEDLAQLRGLAVRGAQQARCPLPLQVQMRYLSQRLQRGTAGQANEAQALQQLQRELIEPAAVSISPTACFALLTPLIDKRLERLQAQLV